MNKLNLTKALTFAIMLLALTLSFVHISELFGLMGAGWEKWTAPFLIDSVAVVGKLATSAEFSAPTRRAGRRALWVAGSISLVANVAVGYVEAQYGAAVLGAFVVAAALWGESMIAALRPVAKRTPKVAPKVADPKRSAAAKKAAATRAAKKAAAARFPVQRTAPDAETIPATRYI